MKANVLVVGPTGVGKSYSLRTLAEHKETFVLATEPGIEHILGKSSKDGDLHGKAHWHYIPPAKTDWSRLRGNALTINTSSMESLQKMQGMGKSDYQQFMEMIDTCANFKCDICGEEFGAVDEWDDSRAFVLDGLSGAGMMSMNLTTGAKPIKTQPEWGVAMDNLENFINKCTMDTKCTFVLIAHLEREHDEITGGTIKTVSTLGRKLAPKIPRYFDEVILAVRDGSKFSWSTADLTTDLKTRLLPIQDGIRPDFGLIFSSER